MNLHGTAAAMLAASPQQAPQLSVNGTGVGIGVLVIVIAGGGTIYLIKHKKINGKHAAVCIAFGLSMAGTSIGGMIAQFLAQTGTVVAQILGTA